MNAAELSFLLATTVDIDAAAFCLEGRELSIVAWQRAAEGTRGRRVFELIESSSRVPGLAYKVAGAPAAQCYCLLSNDWMFLVHTIGLRPQRVFNGLVSSIERPGDSATTSRTMLGPVENRTMPRVISSSGRHDPCRGL